MALRDYLVGEIGCDHQEGLLSRREALRRLGLLGLGAAAAPSVLAAFGDDGGPATTPSPPSPAGSAATTASSVSAAPSAAAGSASPDQSGMAASGEAQPITF